MNAGLLALGDDWTDEDMFTVIPEESYSIKVGIASTPALSNVRSPKEVMRLLELLAGREKHHIRAGDCRGVKTGERGS